MLGAELAALVGHRSYPSVSLLVNLDPALGPWEARLAALHRDAGARLALEPGVGAMEVLAALDAAVAAASPERSARALAVYANRDTSSVLGLPVPVRDRVVIDETFATRDVVHAVNRSPGWWLLALDLQRPRLLHGTGADLHPVDFPLEDQEPTPISPSRRARHRVDDRRVRRLRRLRQIDLAVATAVADRAAPLVVVGAEPTVSQFATLAAPRRLAIVRRSTRAGTAELYQLAAPELRRLDAERCAEALAVLDRHIATGRCATGIDAAWTHAHQGGGAVALVEAGFEHPARLADDGTLVPALDRDAPDVVDDAVDDLIEAVLARGGRSQILPDGTLEHVGRIAVLTRHRVPACR